MSTADMLDNLCKLAYIVSVKVCIFKIQNLRQEIK